MSNHLSPASSTNKPKTDRRVQRTEQLLREALIALILEKGYDDITVQDILDRANMGRSTFYAHYHDKDDLLLSGFQALFDYFRAEYWRMAKEAEDPAQIGRDLSLFFFRHAGSQRALFRAMIGQQGGKVVMENIQRLITNMIREHLSEQLGEGQKSAPLDLMAHYIASSYLSLLTWWLDHDTPYSAEEMDRLFQRLVFPGLRQMFSSQSE